MENKKEKLTEELSKRYSLNKISLEEYERLIERVQNIETEKEALALEKTLYESYKNIEQKAAGERRVRNEYTILSSRRTSGLALNEINGKIICILGDNHIAISKDDLIKDETVIHAIAILGDVVIHIPDDVNVINKAIPILGGVFDNEKNADNRWRKKLIIEGKAILGNITVMRADGFA